jgi:hypothetical protein
MQKVTIPVGSVQNLSHYSFGGDSGACSSGLEQIAGEHVELYFQSCAEYASKHGQPEQSYVKGSNEQCELHHRIEFRPNRLVACPGSLLHPGLVDPAVDINPPDPRTGRPTANIFVVFFPLCVRD